MCRFIPLTAVAVVAAIATESLADTVQLAAIRDNTMWSQPDDNSNGAGEYLFAGNNAGGTTRRCLLDFDVAGNIPACAEITEVKLILHMSRTIAGDEDMLLHRVLADWGEGASDAGGQEGDGAPAETDDVTWLQSFFGSVDWTNDGGDFDPAASAITVVGNAVGYYEWTSAGMIDDVNAWLADPSSEHGWILLGNEANPFTAKRFDSREHLDSQEHPVLEITFQSTGSTDITGDGIVDVSDLLALLAQWGACGSDCTADVNCDGTVDVSDLLAVLADWG